MGWPTESELLLLEQEKVLQHVAAEPSLPGIGLDLEEVMRNSHLDEALITLPLRKFASLLSDDRCRVASENTVAAAVLERVDCERARSIVSDMEHVQSAELRAQIVADVVRVPHLSSLFAVAMPTFASQLTTVLRPELYALGRELHHLPADLRETFTKEFTIPRCWLSIRRPPSTVTALEFEWEPSSAELADKLNSGETFLASSTWHFFAGMEWGLGFKVYPVPDNGGCTVGLEIVGEYPLETQGPPIGATVDINILAPHKTPSLHRQHRYTSTAGMRFSWPNLFGIPPMQKWDQSLMQQWTSPEGFLTVRVKVSNVM